MVPMTTPDAPFRIEDAPRREVDLLIAQGLLEPLLPGVVGPAGCTQGLDARVVAAALALPPLVRERGALAQQAAAWIWCGGTPPPVVDVAVPRGRGMHRAGEVVTHERRMPDVDVTSLPIPSIGGSTADPAGDPAGDPGGGGCGGGGPTGVLVVTTPARTVVDLLRLLPETEAVAWAAPVARVAGTTADDVHACLERMPRARGVPRARRLAAGLAYGQSIRLPVIR